MAHEMKLNPVPFEQIKVGIGQVVIENLLRSDTFP